MIESNKHLIERLKNDDESAFEIIYRKFVPRLYYFISEYIPHKDIAENVVQETMMVLWNKRQNLVNDTNLAAYLFTVAKNNCLYKLRDIRYHERFYGTATSENFELTANYSALELLDTSHLIMDEIESIVDRTMEQLSPQCRAVFKMSRFDEKKNREIAEELNISVKAVEGHITKALKVFRVALKDYLPFVAFLFVR